MTAASDYMYVASRSLFLVVTSQNAPCQNGIKTKNGPGKIKMAPCLFTDDISFFSCHINIIPVMVYVQAH